MEIEGTVTEVEEKLAQIQNDEHKNLTIIVKYLEGKELKNNNKLEINNDNFSAQQTLSSDLFLK